MRKSSLNTNWARYSLKQVIDEFIVPMRDKPPSWAGNIPWCRIEDFDGKYLFGSKSEQFVDQHIIQSMNLKVYPIGTVLCSCSAKLGVCTITAVELVSNQTFIGLVPGNLVDTEFLYYKMTSQAEELQKMSSGTTIAYLPRAKFEDFEIDLPDKSEQQKIATILSTIDRAIAHTEALIEKYHQIKAGLMHDLFTRGIGADGKLRPTREEAPELYQESAIGWIPKKWDVLQLRDCLIDNPTNGIYKSQDQIGQGTLMIGQTAFTEERSINFSLCRRGVISEAEKQHYYVAENNILITRVFATVDGVGLPTLVPQIHEEAVFESNMMRLRVDETKISSLILFEWLRNHRLRRLIVSGANASNQVSINQKTFNVLPIPLPSHDEQMRIANTIIASDSKHFTEKANLRKLVQKKSGLMHDLLTGKVPVNVNPDEVDRI